jgi:N-acetylglucosaminyldiphosphoundecaprenol N-acetyl-beta-D-mannosaminyltransferase
MPRLEVLGLPLDPLNRPQAAQHILGWLGSATCHQVVTLNPEITVRAQHDQALRQAIREAELVTADGEGMVWAAQQLCGVRLSERVTGIDLCQLLFEQAGPKLRVFMLGAQPGVAQQAAHKLQQRYGIQIAGVADGFFRDEQAVLQQIAQAHPNLLLVGMGERQDTFIHRHKAHLSAAVAIGVGGSFDVWSGQVSRVPAWAQQLRLEWLVRIASDRKRWGRFPRLIRFVQLVRRARRVR